MNNAADWYADQEQRERILKTDTKAKMRLIDADALAESDMAKLIDRYLYNQCNLTVGLAAALMPEIEAEPVRHGRWIVHTTWHGMFGLIHSECSECKFDRNGDLSSWKFCPDCGAKMEGGANNG